MNYPTFKLDNKTAIVTGGNKGIGKGIALCLANAGADVVITGRHEDELQETAAEIRKSGRKALPVVMDVTKIADVKSLVSKTIEEFGKIDILVNNAGVSSVLPAEEHTEEIWDRIINTNLKGVFLCSAEVGKIMIAQKSGAVVNISSQASLVALPGHAAYCASKGGVNMLTKVCALEWAEHNIRVNAVAPTFINTPMIQKLFGAPEDHERLVSKIPLGEFGDLEDVGAAVIYLASSASKSTTGHVLLVDGGWTIQ